MTEIQAVGRQTDWHPQVDLQLAQKDRQVGISRQTDRLAQLANRQIDTKKQTDSLAYTDRQAGLNKNADR